MFEWNITCKDWKWDEVDGRPCDKRCDFEASVGVAGYFENDDDVKRDGYGGLAVRSSGRTERTGYDAWFRAQWNGLSLSVEWMQREIDFTLGTNGLPTTAKTQTDSGASATLHYRFADSNWGVGVRYGVIWLDDDYSTLTSGPQGNTTTITYADKITEYGVRRELLLLRPQQQDHGRRELGQRQLGRQHVERGLHVRRGARRARRGRRVPAPPVADQFLTILHANRSLPGPVSPPETR